MKSLKALLVAVGAFVVLVALAGLVPVRAQHIVSPTPVTVTNTPLPTTVTNDTAHPVPTLGVDNPASQPFQETLCGFSSNCLSGLPETFNVPTTTNSGAPVKHLVITFISGSCTDQYAIPRDIGVNATAPSVNTGTDQGGASNNYMVPVLTATNPNNNGITTYNFATPTTIYADAGASVGMSGGYDTTGPTNSQMCTMQLQGFLATQ